jgi:hypothetical protein
VKEQTSAYLDKARELLDQAETVLRIGLKRRSSICCSESALKGKHRQRGQWESDAGCNGFSED